MKGEWKSGFLRKWILNGSMAAALIASVVVFIIMLQIEKNMLTQYERSTIFVAAEEIPEGQMITSENYQEYFEEKQLDKSCVPPTALNRVEQIEGLAAEADIEKGVLLTEGMFEQINDITKDMDQPVIAGFRAEDLYQVVGGTLRAGDRIHIYSVSEADTAMLIWSNLYVQQVFDNAGNNITNADTTTAAQRVNVYMDNSDVKRFYSELSVGNLRVVKVCD